MNKKLTYVNGWNGGHYELDGVIWPNRDTFRLYVNGKYYPHVIETLYGEDYEHGHIYKWTREQIKIGLGTNLRDYTAYIPVENIMSDGDWDEEDMDDLFTIHREFTVELVNE